MQFSSAHLAIAIGVAAVLVLSFLGYLYWLTEQPPVLSRSPERDPLTQMPISITMNPFRDRTIERTANAFIAEMRAGNCRHLLAQWERDYRRKRADFLCSSETLPTIFGALEDQLGLKLEPTKGTIPTLIIDHIE